MAKDFYCTFDSTVDADIPSGLVPDTNTNTRISAASKVGTGSVSQNAAGASRLVWSTPYTVVHRDEGKLSFWYQTPPILNWNSYVKFTKSGGNRSRIQIIHNVEASDPDNEYRLLMYDADGNSVVDVTVVIGYKSVWHFIELLWLWNDAAGSSVLKEDGVVIINSTNGNDKTRVQAATLTEVDIQISASGPLGVTIDDLSFFQERYANALMTLGAPFAGGMSRMGR